MGKSLKNSVSPDEMAEEYGCDTLRVYEMYMGPLDASKPWSTRDVVGAHRFLQRVWRNMIDDRTGELKVSEEEAGPELRRLMHKTIKRVSDDMDGMRYNTAIAGLIELNNALVAARYRAEAGVGGLRTDAGAHRAAYQRRIMVANGPCRIHRLRGLASL